MKQNNQIILYSMVLLIGLVVFILELFVFEIDGILGFLIIGISVCVMIGSAIQLYKLSSKIKEVFKSILNLLFNIGD